MGERRSSGECKDDLSSLPDDATPEELPPTIKARVAGLLLEPPLETDRSVLRSPPMPPAIGPVGHGSIAPAIAADGCCHRARRAWIDRSCDRWICEQAHQPIQEALGLDHFERRSLSRSSDLDTFGDGPAVLLAADGRACTAMPS